MMVHLSQTPPNMSSIGAVCDSLGKTFLRLLVGNLGVTGGLRVNLSPVKRELITFPLFLPEGNAILPMTAKAVCAGVMWHCMLLFSSLVAWILPFTTIYFEIHCTFTKWTAVCCPSVSGRLIIKEQNWHITFMFSTHSVTSAHLFWSQNQFSTDSTDTASLFLV